MRQPDKPKAIYDLPILNLGIALASQIGIVVIGVVLIVVVIGVWLDKTLGTKPIFTIILLLGSGPVSLYLVYRLALNAVARIHTSKPPDAEAAKEDIKRE